MKKNLLIALSAVILFLMPNVTFGQAPPLGSTSNFALFTASGAFNNTGGSMVTGDIGSNIDPIVGFPDPGTVDGVTYFADDTTAQAAADVLTLYAYLAAYPDGPVHGTTLVTETLTPNVYTLGAASTLDGNLTLDAEGNPDAIFIIKVNGALSTSAGANVILINSASLCNVWWQVNGQFELGTGSVFRGNVVTNGAITLLEGSSLLGRGLSQGGAITLQNNVVTMGGSIAASVITASGATTICAGDNVVLSGNVGGTWSNGETTATITVTASGDYSVTNASACGSATSNHITVTVNPLPTASIITASSAITFLSGDSVILSGNNGGTWNTGETTPSITVDTTGNYFVTNTNGCGDAPSNHIIVTVSLLPVASIITASDSITFFVGDSVILSGNNGGIWNTGETTPSITVDTTGTYFVININNGDTVTSNLIEVTVNLPPVASIISASDETTFFEGDSIVLSGNVGGTWNTGETTPSITVDTTGNYYVTNTVADSSVTSNHIIVTVNLPPTASIISAGGAATTFCAGGSVVLSGNNGGTWSNAASTSSITVTTTGDYFVTNTVADSSVTSNHISVTVNPSTGATSFTVGATIVCQDAADGTYTATAANSTSVAYSVLPLTAGAIDATNGVMNWDAAFSGEATIKATSTGLCGITTAEKVVTVNPSTGATSFTTGVTTVCQDAADGTYTATAANSTSVAYSVSPAEAGAINATTGVMNWDAAFNGTATIKATSTGSCGITTAEKVVTVNPSTGVTAFTVGAITVCQDAADETYTATAANSTSIAYSVLPAAAGVINAATGVMNWDAAFSETATIKATSTGLCGITSAERAVTVRPAPSIVTEPTAQSVCVGSPVSFSVTAAGTGLTYQWRKGTVNLANEGNVSGATSATLTIDPANIYDAASNFNVVINGTCSPVETSINVALVVNTAPDILGEPYNQNACLGGCEESFLVTATGTGLSYQWRRGTVNLTNGGNISGATSAMLTFSTVNYSDTASNYNVVVSGTCLPNSTSENVSLQICAPTGLASNKKADNSVAIYPNPFTTTINIKINDASKINTCQLRLYNELGKEVMISTVTKPITVLETSKLPIGIYFYKIISNNKTIQTGKLVSQQ